MYTGMDTVNMLYEMMKVEDEWSVRYENGFKWRPGNRAQTVEVAGESERLIFSTGYYISIRTEICKESNLGSDICRFLNGQIMHHASLAGLVYNPDKGVIELCSWLLVVEPLREWMETALWAAAAWQIYEREEAGSRHTFHEEGEPVLLRHEDPRRSGQGEQDRPTGQGKRAICGVTWASAGI